MRMRRVLWSAGLLAVVGLGAGCAHDEAKQARSQGEQVGEALAEKARFADQLSLLNQEQIALGNLALQKSQNPEVRHFAEELIRNHKKNQDDLETLAGSKLAMLDLSEDAQAIGGAGTEGMEKGIEKGKEKYNKQYDKQVMKFLEKRDALMGLSGREFDKAFLDEVEDGQDRGKELIEEGLDEYRDDASLAIFLGRTGPVLSGHRQQAEMLKGYIAD